MSLSSFLLPSTNKTAVDAELDALFKTNEAAAGPSSRPAEPTTEKTSKDSRGKGKKRKGESSAAEEPVKRRKSESQKAAPTPTPAAKLKPAKPKEQKKPATSKKDDTGKAKISGDEDSEEENADLEDGYLNARVQAFKERDEDDAEVENGSDEDEDEDADADAIPIHESLKKDKKSSSRSGPKLKYVPAEETPEQRNRRTIFVGNLSTDVAQKRPLQKQLHRHILQYIPDAKIESTRFRSVAFATPTANPSADSSDGKTPSKRTPSSDPKSARQHDLSRTSAWRDRQTQSDDVSLKADEKKFLTPSQKKKIAFINQEFHSSADTVNAYIVFAHPIPKEELEKRPKNLPPLKEVLDPYEAAKKAVVKCDGTTFMERLIRVDLVGGKGAPATKEAGEEGLALVGADPKLSIFVGNLDFASKEEDLRVFFEGVVAAEKGTPPSPGEDESGKKTGWVTRVRIVRDKDTQMGKGFAYVQFTDRECVDEILAMEEGKIKFAKRKLRVQRCKTLPGSSTSTRQITSDNKQKPSTDSASAKKRPAPTPNVIPTVPRGDPSLGEKLAGLSKDARKQAKSSNADRVARRLAKKKARLAMAKTGPSLKLGSGAGGKVGKERVRVRKSGRDDGGKGKPVKKAKSGRVRSEKAIQNRNRKREA